MDCKICGRELKDLRCLGIHLKSHNISTEKYYNQYLVPEEKKPFVGICHNKNCGNKTTFKNMNVGYTEYCSQKCSTSSEERKEKTKNTNIRKYGKSHFSQLNSTKEKKKQLSLEKFGTTCTMNSKEAKEKARKTCLQKYGTDHSSKSELIKEKIINTNIKKYGVRSTLLNKTTQEKIKKTIMDLYNVDNVSKSDIIKEKKKQTCLKNFGVDNPSNNYEINNKRISNNISKYGVSCTLRLDWVQKKSKDTIKNNFYNHLISSSRLDNKVTPLFSSKEYKGVKHRYSWKCNKCGNIFEDHLDNSRIPRCYVCFPKLHGVSNLEKEVYSFVKELCSDVEENNRSILSDNKELDIYIPSKNLAIEFDGLFWHSEISGGKDKNYHLNKTIECQNKNIQLIHIFDDEWIDKKQIIQSILCSKLGKTICKIPARKCSVIDVDSNISKSFLDNNHLQGHINGKNIGLTYNNELVSILTYGKPRFDKKYEFEILRFCNKIDTTVVGGLSRLLSKINSKSIISYVDRRFGTGKSYKSCNFVKTGESSPSYYYTNDDYNIRYNRLQFQKHLLKSKLESFDPSLTEWQNMQLNGYDRIWDCGNLVYIATDTKEN